MNTKTCKTQHRKGKSKNQRAPNGRRRFSEGGDERVQSVDNLGRGGKKN